MPRIKRWFPVSQEINRDAQLWELCRLYGDRALRIWLELLSIADRNDGSIPGASAELPPDLRRALADASRTTGRTVAEVWRTIGEWSWINPSTTPMIAKYWKYHVSRETKEILRGKPDVSPPNLSEPSEPSLLKNKISSELWQEEDYWLRDLLIGQAWLSSNGALHDPAWWEALSTELNGISPEWLREQLAKMQAWCIENPKRKPTKKGVKRFVRSWLEKSAEERRRNASQQRR